MTTTIPMLLFVSVVATGFAPQSAVQKTDPPNASASPASFTWGDYDADGLFDALAVTPAGELRLLRNRGDGSFDDITKDAGLDAVHAARFGLWGDFDEDGRIDLFIGTWTGPSHLFHNTDAGVFEDVAATSGLVTEEDDRSAQWLDYDADGRLDLFVVTSQTNHVYHALRNRFFERVELGHHAVVPDGWPLLEGRGHDDAGNSGCGQDDLRGHGLPLSERRAPGCGPVGDAVHMEC